MRWYIPWPTIHLICVMPYFRRLEEVEHHEVILAEDKSVYNERGYAIREAGPSMRVLDMFTTCDDFCANTYTSATSSSSS